MNSTTKACYVGIGANLGNAAVTVAQAIDRLGQVPGTRLLGQSSLFRTAPINASGDDYINAVARIETTLSAQALLDALQSIESDFGRERPYPNAPRTLDLDLLLYGQQTITTPSLNVPHPRMLERAFVLIPLLQLDPMVNVPGQGPAHAFVTQVTGQAIQRI